jgi:small subunit ribosomal protein S17
MAATTKATKNEAIQNVAKTERAVAKAAPAQKSKAPSAMTKESESTKAPAGASMNAITAEELRATDDPKMAGIRLHGKEFVGTVISDKAHKTVTVEWELRRLVSKYERYEKRYSRVYAHNPVTINARTGDTVRVQETRPLSKTKNFVVVEILARTTGTGAAK